jgi:branched-chain amino acid transport system permease protein
MLDEDAARASGINVTYYKSQAFVVAAVITGFAGSLFAHHSQYLNPNDFTFWKSIEILLMVAVGGIGSFAGAVTGAFVVTLLPEYLRAVDAARSSPARSCSCSTSRQPASTRARRKHSSR